MEPFFNEGDVAMFYRYLDKASSYVEFGAGGSTYQASIRPNIREMHVIESDPDWLRRTRALVSGRATFHFCDVRTVPKTGGGPGPSSTAEECRAYSDEIYATPSGVDFVLIDGRFRVACALKCFRHIGSDCVVAFDDYLTRPQYHVVGRFYATVDTCNKSMVILKKRGDVAPPPADLIRHYECIRD
jgi:hypothetical protein